jgi:hypothetical protein
VVQEFATFPLTPTIGLSLFGVVQPAESNGSMMEHLLQTL